MPGESARINGRLGGRPPGPTKSTLMVNAAREKLIEMYKLASEHINVALIKKAMDGDVAAIKELHDRVYGKPLQQVELDATHQVLPLNLTDEQYRQALAAAAGNAAVTAPSLPAIPGSSSDQSST